MMRVLSQFFNHRNPKYTEYTTVYISQTSKNYHDDEHFYRTKISIFSPLKIEKLTAKDLKCSNEDKILIFKISDP